MEAGQWQRSGRLTIDTLATHEKIAERPTQKTLRDELNPKIGNLPIAKT